MTFPDIQYNFPENGINPFSIDSNDKYFVDASGLSNLSKELGVFNFNNFDKHIPTGYKTILILERITFYIRGKNITAFSNSNQLSKSDRYYLISNKLKKTHITEWNRYIESYSILRTNNDASLKSHVWTDFEDAKDIAQKISTEDNSTILICKIIDDINWH